jgi:urease accessory protein UreF
MLVARRQTGELRTEDRHLGAALAKVLSEFDSAPQRVAVLDATRAAGTCYATAFALAAVHGGIPCEPALQADA